MSRVDVDAFNVFRARHPFLLQQLIERDAFIELADDKDFLDRVQFADSLYYSGSSAFIHQNEFRIYFFRPGSNILYDREIFADSVRGNTCGVCVSRKTCSFTWE